MPINHGSKRFIGGWNCIFTHVNARLLHKKTHKNHDLFHAVKQISHVKKPDNVQKGIISNKPAPIRELVFYNNTFGIINIIANSIIYKIIGNYCIF